MSTFPATAVPEPAAPVCPFVGRLRVVDFRCYERLDMADLGARPVVLYGANGAGKTNVLEAVSLLGPGRGLRRAKLPDLNRQAALANQHWAITADITLETSMPPITIGTGRDPQAAAMGRDRRLVRLNGEAAKSQLQLGEYLSLVWLTPQMDRLFQVGASERRSFFDRLVYACSPAHGTAVSNFDKLVQERNRLLKRASQEPVEPQWLEALEQQMAPLAAWIAVGRQRYAEQLDALCRQTLPPFPAAQLALDGELEALARDGKTEAEITEIYQTQLQAERRQHIHAGLTLTGPHRSDLAVTHAAKQVAAHLCSTGEQKALLVGIVLAGAQLQADQQGRLPILLLDEVAAHLDENRRAALFEKIVDFGAQVWLTGTDCAIFEPLQGRSHVFEVDAAQLFIKQ